jgi:septal ring factor EnvC (AmiA/AmiB activator)
MENDKMSNFEKIYNEIKEVNEKVTDAKVERAEQSKDIEYIKKELKEIKESKKENKKILVAIVTSGVAFFATALKWITG